MPMWDWVSSGGDRGQLLPPTSWGQALGIAVTKFPSGVRGKDPTAGDFGAFWTLQKRLEATIV